MIYHVQWVSLRKIFITWWLKNKLKRICCHIFKEAIVKILKKKWENLLPISIDCFIGGSLSLGIYCLDKSNINCCKLTLDTYWAIANCCYIRKFQRKSWSCAYSSNGFFSHFKNLLTSYIIVGAQVVTIMH